MTDVKRLLPEFRSLPASVLSDALESLGLGGAMWGIGPMNAGLPRMAGLARTVLQGDRPTDASPVENLTRHVQFVDEEIGADDVVVVAIAGGAPASSWGALLSMRCRKIGAAGTVVDGPVRDPNEIRALDYPVFSMPGFCAASSKLRMATLDTDVPVDCGGVRVTPGDVVVGDDSGVVVIPPDRAQEVLVLARRAVDREAVAVDSIDKGRGFLKDLK